MLGTQLPNDLEISLLGSISGEMKIYIPEYKCSYSIVHNSLQNRNNPNSNQLVNG